MSTREIILERLKKNLDMLRKEPTKPSKPGSVGFVGSSPYESEKIQSHKIPSTNEMELGGMKSSDPTSVVVASDGRVLVWSNDPPHIRVYAWALQTLRFIPVDAQTSQILKIPSGEMDRIRIRKLAFDLRMTEQEVQGGLDRLVTEGDLTFKTERGRRIFFLAPLRY